MKDHDTLATLLRIRKQRAHIAQQALEAARSDEVRALADFEAAKTQQTQQVIHSKEIVDTSLIEAVEYADHSAGIAHVNGAVLKADALRRKAARTTEAARVANDEAGKETVERRKIYLGAQRSVDALEALLQVERRKSDVADEGRLEDEQSETVRQVSGADRDA